MLCGDLRVRSNAIFYLKDSGKSTPFSMMSLKEELRSEFYAFLIGGFQSKKVDFISLLFSNDRFSGGNFEKIPRENQKQEKFAA
jgi:hypothetical protein